MEDYDWSPDGKRLLLFTNSEKVWRENTRGDYWLIDLASGPPRKLGGRAAKPSTLMFATFSPDGGRVAYVRENNLYVEELATGRITALTRDGSRTTINGTFDWVNEEEFALRNGFRWSPDGKRIAYWQLDASGVRDFDLIDDTDSLYSFVVPVQYPKAGTTNSAVRVGVVSAAGGPTRWIATPGDPRNNYIARMEWAASSDEIVLQHLDRLQHTLTLMLGDARTGAARPILVERDSAWVDVVNDLRWLDGGRSFTWVSERDGWRHLYVVSRDGKSVRLRDAGQLRHPEPGQPVRRARSARRGRARGRRVLHRVAGESDAALSVRRAPRRHGHRAAHHADDGHGHARLRHRAERTVRAAHGIVVRRASRHRSRAPAWPRGRAHADRQRRAARATRRHRRAGRRSSSASTEEADIRSTAG